MHNPGPGLEEALKVYVQGMNNVQVSEQKQAGERAGSVLRADATWDPEDTQTSGEVLLEPQFLHPF